MTLTFCLAMTSGVLSLLLGAYGVKLYSRAIFVSIIIFCLILPLIHYFIFLQAEPFVPVLDWPLEAGSFLSLWNPFSAIWLTSILGGFLGIISGNYWGQGDVSCLRCLLVPFILIFLLSIVIIFLP
ncbi:MAG: hypothetical protein ACFFEF_14765 [Candidatus Thorarchaeota archaeon]